MSPANEEKLLREVAQIRSDMTEMGKEVHTLTSNLLGDKFVRPPIVGVMDIVELYGDEIYGNVKTQRIGLKQKVEQLEVEYRQLKADRKADRNWILATASGISTGIGIAWFFAQLWLGK